MDIQLAQILFQIVNFSVVAGALVYLLYKPIQKILEERSARIEEGQKAAAEAIAERDQLTKAREAAEKDARKEAVAIIESAKKDADKLTQELTAKAQEHAKQQLLKVQSEWQDQKKELVKELKLQFAEGVFATAAKIGMSLDKKAHAALIDQELEAVIKRLS
jgi:F-type H+-transporting ATPase subunit b